MAFLSDLNPVQREAVRTIDGPVMIVAGAGSGKTRVLTYRIAYLLQCGVPAHNILSLTFTNKAAREMRERIEQVVGDESRRLWMGTFHSTFARLLRRDAEHLGFQKSFTVYDTDDSQNLVKAIMHDMNINTQQVAPAAVRHAISGAKNRMKSVDEVTREAVEIFERRVAQVYGEYQKRLHAANAMDFDDLILHPIKLFDAHPEVLEHYQKLFRFILIDEYQDTNLAQYQIVRRLAASHQNICVVGDDAQSIYAFRGADIRNILEFERTFDHVRVFRLEQNYRSTGMILRGADSLIKHNPKQIQKTLWTENHEGDPITILELNDEMEEAQKIVYLMQEEGRRKKLQLKDFAVLYRTNAQSRAMEDAFRRSGIPYTIVGGVAFYRRKEIKDVLAYLRLLVNPSDDEAVVRVINYPQRGIGATTIARLRDAAASMGVPLFAMCERAQTIDALNAGAVRRITDFVTLVRKYANLRTEMSAGELAGSLVDELGIVAEFKNEGTMEARQRLDNIKELLSALADFQPVDGAPTLEAFLAEASLVADVDALTGERNAVTLMTLHAAKGLEFPVVFLVGMEENLFPSSLSIDRDQVEEERRLCYVGMTRAMQKLYMTHARSRMVWGERAPQMPSRFLDEIDADVVQRESGRRRTAHTASAWGSGGGAGYSGNGSSGARTGAGKSSSSKSSTSRGYGSGAGARGTTKGTARAQQTHSEYSQMGAESYSQLEEGLHAGSNVVHATFGRGRVLELQGSGDMTRVVVLFQSVGRKTLVLKFASLRVDN